MGNADLQQAALEAELRKEVAESLGRAEDKVDHALLALELIGRRHDGATGAAREALAAAYNAARDDALRLREYLLIQREALGFLGNDTLERVYPIPPRR